MATPQGQNLAQTHLFRRAVKDYELSKEHRLLLTHQRAKAIATTFGTHSTSNFDSGSHVSIRLQHRGYPNMLRKVLGLEHRAN
jgi:hypothetical protein